MDNPLLILLFIGVAIAAVAVLVMMYFVISFFGLWLQAQLTSATVGFHDLIGMFFRRVGSKPHHYRMITISKIMASQAGLNIATRDLESHYLAGGNVPNVVRALIAADRAGIPLTYKQATAIDLAGRNVLEAVQTSVLP
ncbi:MAG: flotillin-like FloA family protein, partial [Planctomycetia bacterium]